MKIKKSITSALGCYLGKISASIIIVGLAATTASSEVFLKTDLV